MINLIQVRDMVASLGNGSQGKDHLSGKWFARHAAEAWQRPYGSWVATTFWPIS